LAGRTTRDSAAAVVLQRAALAVTDEGLLHARSADAVPTELALRAIATFRADRSSARRRAARLSAFAAGNAGSTDADVAPITDDRLANALDAGLAFATVRQTGTTQRGGDAHAIAAFFLRDVATVAGAAGKFERFAADARVLVALARWAAGGPTAAVVRVGAAHAVAEELPLGTGLRGSSVQTRGGRTSKDGAPEEALEYVATRKPSGQRTRQCVEAPVVHLRALLTGRILSVEVRPVRCNVDQLEGAYSP
jgi:hypothetical protein